MRQSVLLKYKIKDIKVVVLVGRVVWGASEGVGETLVGWSADEAVSFLLRKCPNFDIQGVTNHPDH